MSESELKDFLDQKVLQYNQLSFVEDDPIQIPKQFSLKQDIEISAFLTATIAWGNRKSIIKDANKMMQWMDFSPYEFIKNSNLKELQKITTTVHRTFSAEDFHFFILQLKRLYVENGSLESYFIPKKEEINCLDAVERFRDAFFLESLHRSQKHISSPKKGSATKRLNMFLRWMVRKDAIDFGIWENIPASKLSIPLDVHVANVARSLGILSRKQNDRKAVEELDSVLRKLKPEDPTSYDFALFGLGVFEKFK